MEGRDTSDWVVIDAGSVVIHFMTPEARKERDLEGLWASVKNPLKMKDVEEISWEDVKGKMTKRLERIARISLLQAYRVPTTNGPATDAESLTLNPSSDALMVAIKKFAKAYEDLVKEAGSRETLSKEAMIEPFEIVQALANGVCVDVGPFVRVCV
ncbi:hypothetical protein BGZ89_002452 [Linnemannia elongata]|nr:hypothetical protein BGZ89_002452 [Linnemannia elongata]